MRKGRSSQQVNPGRSMLAGKTEATTHLVIRSNRRDIRSRTEVVPFGSRKEHNHGIAGDIPRNPTYQYVEDLPPAIGSAPTSSGRTPADARCHNVQEIAINRVTEGADFNWSTCVLSSGSADANTAARAAIHVQSVLRRDYDLLTD